MSVKFNTNEWATIANGLRTAAESYGEIAAKLAGDKKTSLLAETFLGQKEEALRLAIHIETEEGV